MSDYFEELREVTTDLNIALIRRRATTIGHALDKLGMTPIDRLHWLYLMKTTNGDLDSQLDTQAASEDIYWCLYGGSVAPAIRTKDQFQAQQASLAYLEARLAEKEAKQ